MEWQYEWDGGKRDANLRNHNVDFVDVRNVFGPEMLVRADVRRDYGEQRYIGMAPLEGRLIVVIFTYRGENIIRIISASTWARKANRREQKIYFKARTDKHQEAGCDD